MEGGLCCSTKPDWDERAGSWPESSCSEWGRVDRQGAGGGRVRGRQPCLPFRNMLWSIFKMHFFFLQLSLPTLTATAVWWFICCSSSPTLAVSSWRARILLLPLPLFLNAQNVTWNAVGVPYTSVNKWMNDWQPHLLPSFLVVGRLPL